MFHQLATPRVLGWLALSLIAGLHSANGQSRDLLANRDAWEVGKVDQIEWAHDAVWLKSQGVDDEVSLVRRIEIDDAVAVRVDVEVALEEVRRGKNSWHSGRLLIQYLNGDGVPIGDPFALDRLEGTSDWRYVGRQFPVPDGAQSIDLSVELFRAQSGRIGFRNLTVQALDRAESESWRQAADQRIDRYRKADVVLRVVDASGAPVVGAEVRLLMRRHAYPFGTAVKAPFLIGDDPDEDILVYRSVIEHFFNYATLENALKDRMIHKNGIEPAVRALRWLRERDIRTRGHVLIWPSWKQTPSAYKELEDDPKRLRELIRGHFQQTLAATAGLVEDWDVVNEPAVHNDLIDLFGDEIVADFFRWAREGAPDANLYLNENNVEFGGANTGSLRQWAERLIEASAPIDGLGFQGHMWHKTMPSGQNILDDIQAFEPLGLKLQITEYDANARFSAEDEARYLDELLHAWFSHPTTDGFILWGIRDDWIWTKNAPLFRNDWSLKPAGKVWMERIFGDWWTEVVGATDSSGVFRTRGFLGEYLVDTRTDKAWHQLDVELTAEGIDQSIVLQTSTPAPPAPKSFNPYRSGKLPNIRKQTASKNGHLKSGRLQIGEGDLAVLSNPTSKSESENPATVAYLRFAIPESLRQHDVPVRLVVHLSSPSNAGEQFDVYALSRRFVAESGELGSDWTASHLTATNAPALLDAGGFRLGDASALFVGTFAERLLEPHRCLIVENAEFNRLVRESAGNSLTIMVVSESGSRFLGASSQEPPYLEWTVGTDVRD